MSLFSRQLVHAAVLALAVAFVAVPFGYFLNANFGWAIFCTGLVWQLCYQLRYFARLAQWTAQPAPDRTLEGSGAWDQVFEQIYRHEKDLHAQIKRRDADIARFEAAGQALNDGVIMLNERDQIDWCNSMAELQLSLDIRTDQGQPIVNMVRQPEFVAYLKNADFSQPLLLRSERNGDCVFSIYILPYAAHKRLMQVKDVTQADRLDRMRRDFVANVSHELRTPLTVLAGFLETLQEIDVDRDAQIRYLALMAEQSERMQNIVQDLLTLSSLEAAPPPDSGTVDIASLLDKLRRDAQALSGGRHTIQLESQGEGDLRGSEPEITSAFGNLVANAVRYTPAQGSILLSWKTGPKGAEFSVQDTGIGIEAQHIPRLTERFYRVDRGRSRDSGGTGLGLAIVKHSLSRHQARLEISSTPGKGSRFTALFPANRVVSS